MSADEARKLAGELATIIAVFTCILVVLAIPVITIADSDAGRRLRC